MACIVKQSQKTKARRIVNSRTYLSADSCAGFTYDKSDIPPDKNVKFVDGRRVVCDMHTVAAK